MQTTAPIDVSGLKGLHIPATPDIFPLSAGWWLVIILLIGFILFLYFALHAWHHSLRYQVSKEFHQIEKIQDNKKMFLALNRLAKQVAIARFGREQIAPLYDDEWISFMNSLLKKELFSKEYVDLLHKSMYAEKIQVPDDKRQSILQDYKKWFQEILKK